MPVQFENPTQYLSSNSKSVDCSNWWDFSMSKRLDNSVTNLLPGESIIVAWTYNQRILTLYEWFMVIITLGLYYIKTQVYSRKNHLITIYLTNRRIIGKEKIYESVGWFCIKYTLHENQASYNLNDLAYVCAEHRVARMLSPSNVFFEMHFSQYPAAFHRPGEHENQSNDFFSKFLKAWESEALKLEDVEIDSTPVLEFIQSQDVMASATGQVSSLSEIGNTASKYISDWQGLVMTLCKAAMKPVPSKSMHGPEENARVLSVDIDLSQDPLALLRMNRFLHLLNECLPERGDVVDPNQLDIRQAIPMVTSPTHLNRGDRSSYQSENGRFYINRRYLHLPKSEKVLDVCPDNPRFTYDDMKALLLSGGLYIFTLWNKLAYRSSYMLTDSRLIRHAMRLSKVDNNVLHSRLEMWYLVQADAQFTVTKDDRMFFGLLETNKGHAVSVATDHFGTLNFECNDGAFALKVVRTLMHDIDSRTESLAHIPGENWRTLLSSRGHVNEARLTLLAVHTDGDEHVDGTLHAAVPVSFCTTFRTCGLRPRPHCTITVTDRGVYIENYQQNCLNSVGLMCVFFSFASYYLIADSNY